MKTTADILAALTSVDQEHHTLPLRLCQACRTAAQVDGVGLALMNDDGHQGVVAATDGAATLMEDLQFTLGEGPCWDASRERRPLLQPDLARTASNHWPGFGPAVVEAGIAAIFSFPLHVGAIRLGILDLYRSTPGNLSSDQLAGALAHADAALAILLHLQAGTDDAPGASALIEHPVESRAEIHQATGVVSVQAAVDMASALVLLRAHAFAVDEPILKVSRRVLDGTLRFDSAKGNHE